MNKEKRGRKRQTRKIVDKPCYCCGLVPEKGYYISKVKKWDWQCPDCSVSEKRERRNRKIQSDRIKASKGRKQNEDHRGSD